MSYWIMIHPQADYQAFCLHHGADDIFDQLPVYILAAKRNWFGPEVPVRRRLECYSLAWIKSGFCSYWSEMLVRE